MRFLKKHPELVGIALILFSLLNLIAIGSFHYERAQSNLLGLVGWGLGVMWYGLLGLGSYAFLLIIGWTGTRMALSYEIPKRKVVATILLLSSLQLMLTLFGSLYPHEELSISKWLGFPNNFPLGGLPFFALYEKLPYICLRNLLSATGTAIVTLALLALSFVFLFEDWVIRTIDQLHEAFLQWKKERKLAKKIPPKQVIALHDPKREAPPYHSVRLPSLLEEAEELKLPFVNMPEPLVMLSHDGPNAKRDKVNEPKKQKGAAATPYSFPSIDLLNNPKKSDNSTLVKELKQKAELLEETLLSFGIEAKVGQIYSGPTITSFEVHPAVGVKVGKIKTLEHDIALNLEAQSIRIIAPIPGKACVGIEVPNKIAQEVSFKELLSSYESQNHHLKIPLLLGKTVSGDVVMHDLTKMPHCIIAGATGSGKSVSIHSIVLSILMSASPEQVKLLMIDPKKVELIHYSELPHMISPVITDPKVAYMAFQWLVKEMEKRYEYLKLSGQRHIEGYNHRKIDPDFEKSLSLQLPEHLPYIVTIVDELADLMMSAECDIEAPVARIAQMARAVGIHLVLATQRPSREILTGLIKANFPARIAFKVASRVNSQIILDEIGAEALLGNGDMLLQVPGQTQAIRTQGALVHDDEIMRVVEAITKQAPPNYLIPSFERLSGAPSDIDDGVSNDELFEEAKDTVLSTGNASTTFLQRKLKIGYARAASLMDELERKGIVGPQDGAKPRKIFFPKNSPVMSEESE